MRWVEIETSLENELTFSFAFTDLCKFSRECLNDFVQARNDVGLRHDVIQDVRVPIMLTLKMRKVEKVVFSAATFLYTQKIGNLYCE